ncbi:MAG: hypothetical protein ACLSX0_01760 [Anaerostipes caccae]|jgi:uncharacterized protein (DUF697 family)
MSEQFEETTLVYEQKMDGAELMRYIKAACQPLAIFFLTMYTISTFAQFGRLLLAPLYGSMWAFGAACAFFMPSHRRTIIKETLMTCGIYGLSLVGLHKLMEVTSGVSGQMIAASYDTAITSVFGNTMIGYINNFIWMVSIITPIGFLCMQGKRLLQFKRNKDANKFYNQVRNVRDENKAHMK